jgi:dimeric dUTPase (all-alpha-NTP-PPase superfamily)
MNSITGKTEENGNYGMMDLTNFYEAHKPFRDKVMREKRLNEVYSLQMLLEIWIFSFKVEFSEFANETRFMKVWSEKRKPKDEPLMKEEFIDGFCFLLQIGIEGNWEFLNRRIDVDDAVNMFHGVPTERVFTMIFNKGINDAFDLQNVFRMYFVLGARFGIYPEEIEELYKAKMNINYRRQESGY